MGYGRIRLSGELLKELIPLPVTSTVLGSMECDEVGCIEFVVEDASLPPIQEAGKPKLIRPTFRRNPPVEFVDWGLE